MAKHKPTVREALEKVAVEQKQAAAKQQLLKAAAAFIRAKKSTDVELKKKATLDFTAAIVKQARFGKAIMGAGKKVLKGIGRFGRGAKDVAKRTAKIVKPSGKGDAAMLGAAGGAVVGSEMEHRFPRGKKEKEAAVRKLAAFLKG